MDSRQNDITLLLEEYFKCYPNLKDNWMLHSAAQFKSSSQSRLFDHLPLLCHPTIFEELYAEFENILELFLTVPIPISDENLEMPAIILNSIEAWFKKIGELGYHSFFDAKTREIKMEVIETFELGLYAEKLKDKNVKSDICMAYISRLYQFILGAYVNSSPAKRYELTPLSNSFYLYVQQVGSWIKPANQDLSNQKTHEDLSEEQKAYAMKVLAQYISTHLRDITNTVMVPTLSTTANVQQMLATSPTSKSAPEENLSQMPPASTSMPAEKVLQGSMPQTKIAPTSMLYATAEYIAATSVTLVKSPLSLATNTVSYAKSWMSSVSPALTRKSPAPLETTDFTLVDAREILNGAKTPDAEQLTGSTLNLSVTN